MVIDHRVKYIFELVIESDLGSVNEAVIGRDIHVEVGEILSSAVGWQFIQRLDG